MKKFPLVKLFAIALILLGTPLEAYYYWYSFTQEGVPNVIAVLAATTLILLLSVAVYLTEINKTWWLLSTAVAMFSVVSTSAGQDFAFLDIRNKEQRFLEEKSWAKEDYERILTEISKLNEEYDSYIKELDSSISSLEDRYEWKNTSSTVEKLKQDNRRKKAEQEIKLQEARDKIVSVKIGINTGLYEYYASLLGDRIPAHWLQFIKHTILSIFLMLASPTGVKLWLSYRSYTKKATKKKLFGQEEIPNVLSLHKAADLCGIAHTTLYNAWKKGRLKVEGTPAKVEKEELIRFMGEREKTNAIAKKDVSYLWKGNEDA